METDFEWDESKALLEMGIRITNHGQTPTKLSGEVYLLFVPTYLAPQKYWLLTPWKLLFAKGANGWGWYLPLAMSKIDHVAFTVSDDFPTDLPPFGSVEWEHTFRLEELRKEIGEDCFRGESLSVLVALPQPLADIPGGSFRKLPPTPIGLAQMPIKPFAQLSFEDLQEVE